MPGVAMVSSKVIRGTFLLNGVAVDLFYGRHHHHHPPRRIFFAECVSNQVNKQTNELTS
jgi:hypothetical protein